MTKHYAGTGKWKIFDNAEGQRDVHVTVACGSDPNLVVEVAKGAKLGVVFNGLGHKDVRLVELTESQAREHLRQIDAEKDPVSLFALTRVIDIVHEQRERHGIPTYASSKPAVVSDRRVTAEAVM